MREMNSIFRSWRISFSPAVAKITWCSIGCLGLVCWLKSVKLQKWKMPELYYCTCFKDLNKYNPTILWTHNFCGSSSCQWPPFQVRGLRRQRSFGAFFHCAARLPRPLAQTFQGANGGGLWLQGEQLWEGGVCLLWFHFGDNIYIYYIWLYIFIHSIHIRFHNRFIGMSSAETAGALQPRHCFALSQPEPEFRWSDLSPCYRRVLMISERYLKMKSKWS